jgi:hypothetical protein
MTPTNPAAPSLRPATRWIYIVRWVRVDGRETRHRIFMQRPAAQVFLLALLADGRDAALFVTAATWTEEHPFPTTRSTP